MENTRFKVCIEEKTQDYGKIFLEPLERGYGDTLGNALRRLLLSSIRGAAVTAVKIDGVLHEFSTIKGIREDVIEILMNLKQIPIRAKNSSVETDSNGFKIVTLDSDNLPKDFFTREEKPGIITAKDMPWDNDFEFCGDKILCTLEPDAHLLMEIYIQQGVGYLSAERERPSQPQLPIDALLTDAIFSPVKRVNYQIEPARVGQSIDYERLLLEIWTDGAISPEEALRQAAGIAESYFGQVAKADMIVINPPGPEGKEQPVKEPSGKGTEDLSLRPIEELGLTIRSVNCLRRGGIQLIGDLLSKTHDDLLKIRNLGKKSLKEIEDKISERGLELRQPTEEELRAAASFSSEEEDQVLLGGILDDAKGAVEEAQNALAKDIFEDSSESESEELEHEETPKTKGRLKKAEGSKKSKAKSEPKKDKKKTSAPKKSKQAEVEEKVEEAEEPEVVEAVKKSEKPKKSKSEEPKQKKEKTAKTKTKSKSTEKAQKAEDDSEVLTESKLEQENETKPEKKTAKKSEKSSTSKKAEKSEKVKKETKKEKIIEEDIQEVQEQEDVKPEKPVKKTRKKSKAEPEVEEVEEAKVEAETEIEVEESEPDEEKSVKTKARKQSKEKKSKSESESKTKTKAKAKTEAEAKKEVKKVKEVKKETKTKTTNVKRKKGE